MPIPSFLKTLLPVFLLAVCALAQTPVSRHGQLSVQGNQVVDAQDNPAQLRGMSLFWSQWGENYWNSNVIDWLVDDFKISLIRAPMGVETSNTEDPAYLQDPNTNKDLVETIVQAAIANDIYVIIDWHDHNAHQHLDEAKAFFGEMSEKYGNHPNIIYEIFNEPTDVSWSGVVKPYAEEVISTIRANDQENLIIVGTPNWCQDVDIAAGDQINADNIVYSLHYYAASHKGSLRSKAESALSSGAALFVSEFGTCEYTGDGYVDEAESDTWFSFLDQHNISWANWSVHDKAESASILQGGASTSGGWSESDLTQSGKYIRNILRSYASSEPEGYTLTTSTSGEGSVSRDPNSTTYSSGSSVTLSADPAQGWEFSGWSGDASGNTNPLSITMDSDMSITASFSEVQQTTYALDTDISGQGTVLRDPDADDYESQTDVSITATPDEGYEFTGWTGDITSSENPLSVTMDADMSITANFSEVQQTNYALNTTAEGSGTVDKDPDDEGYAQGTEVAVTATPDEGWIFNGWTGDVSSTENPLSITMDADKSICATFVEQGTQGEELIVNGSFENEDENWHLGVYDAEAEGSVVDEEYETAIDQAGSEHWNVQFTQGGITLEQGKSYCLTFRARAVANRSVVVNVGQNGGAYTSYSELQEVQLSTTMKSHSITFDMTEPTDSNARVEFNSGTNDLNWYIDDVSLKEAASTPVNRTTPLPSGWSASISKGELTLKSPVNDKGAVALYDIRGKLAAMLASGRISAGKTALNLSDIPAGNYILSVRTRSAGETFRKNISVVK